MIQAVLFDFDGVLTTDATGSESVCRYLAQATGISCERMLYAYRKYNRALLYGQATHAVIWPDLCRDLGRDIPVRLLEEAFLHTPLDAEMVALAVSLRRAGYAIGMVTDNKQDRMDAIIAQQSWGNLFGVFAVSAAVGSGKEEEAIFTYALEGLGLSAEACVFIDNTPKNLVVPAGMGMRTIHFDHLARDMARLYAELRDVGVYGFPQGG